MASKIGRTYARCTVCDMDFVISHGGASHVASHVKSMRHKQKGLALEQSSKMTNYSTSKPASPTSKSDPLSVIRAETLFALFLVEHNLPLSASDHAGLLFRAMFPDSRIAKDYGCARSKTTDIVRVCGSEVGSQLAMDMRSGPFVLGTDGSQEGGEKYFPIVVTVERDLKHHTELLSISTCEGSATGEAIFGLLQEELKVYDINWSNCLSLLVDNANVMTGKHKGSLHLSGRKIKKFTWLAVSATSFIWL